MSTQSPNPLGGAEPGLNPFLIWKVGGWAGPAFIVGLLVFWGLVAGFVPPPRQDWSADEVIQFFRANNLNIRIGMVGTALCSGLYMVWSTTISHLIQRIEGPKGLLASIELMGGVATTVVVFLFAIVWLAAAFRIGARTPQEVQILNDLGWLIFNMTFAVTTLQMFAFGTAMLLDARPVPLFPAWLAWLCFAGALSFLSVLLLPFVMDGPFAWHGLLSYWVVLGSYFLWASLASCYVLKAIDRVRDEALARS